MRAGLCAPGWFRWIERSGIARFGGFL